jgi:hypothetical protein
MTKSLSKIETKITSGHAASLAEPTTHGPVGRFFSQRVGGFFDTAVGGFGFFHAAVGGFTIVLRHILQCTELYTGNPDCKLYK